MMGIRERLEVFADTDELVKLLFERTKNSPDELLAECRDSLLGMFSDLHDAADEIDSLRKQLADKDAELKAAWATNRAIDKARIEAEKERDFLEADLKITQGDAVRLTEQLAAVTKERDAIKGSLGCEDCRFFLDRGPNSLTDPAVSDAAFRTVFHERPTYKELQEQLTSCQQQRDELVADANRYRWLVNQAESDHENLSPTIPSLYCPSWNFSSSGWDEKIDTAIDAALAKLGAGETGEVG